MMVWTEKGTGGNGRDGSGFVFKSGCQLLEQEFWTYRMGMSSPVVSH